MDSCSINWEAHSFATPRYGFRSCKLSLRLRASGPVGPHIAKLKARFSLSADPLVQMLKKALEPIAEHLHLELRKQPKQTHGAQLGNK